MHWVNLDARRLADALRVNSRVTSFTPLLPVGHTSDEDCHALFQALAENEGIVKLNLSTVAISDENSDVFWQSVSRHPKLENINMELDTSTTTRGLTHAEKTRGTHALVDALRVNTLLSCARRTMTWKLDNMVRPRLLVNRFRPRVAANAGISEESRTWQRKLLGWALASVSSNPGANPIWMMVSGNANVICEHTLHQ